MARSGRFGGGLAPFGGGTLNIDAAYQVEGLAETPNAPDPHAPPERQYGGVPSHAAPDPSIPIVGPTPVPVGLLHEPVALQPWEPTVLVNPNDPTGARVFKPGFDPNVARYADGTPVNW